MCGIAGVIPVDKSLTGGMLVKMLEGLKHRGPDSTGVGIYTLNGRLDIIKDVGNISTLDENFNISNMAGTHGIGHVRLATESKVEKNYSHPFQSLNSPDISIVHNGQITNYHNLRRKLERKGYIFKTENDSELIAQLTAYYLQKGNDLETVLKISLDELDGTFSFIVATPDKLGIAKDRLAAKPMMLGENEKGLAIASEEISIRRVLGDKVSVTELPPCEVRTWRIS